MAKKSNVEKTLQLLLTSETIADQILVNKHELVALDKRRQETREAIREINKHNDSKVLITIGSMLINMERQKALQFLEKEKVKIDLEINRLRSEQKTIASKLNDVEYKLPMRGLDLKSMSSKEISALKANLPLGS